MTRAHSLFFRAAEPADAESHRARILDGMVRAVAAKGYARATVADVVAIAGVSRRTFYEQFADKEDCFLAAYETGSQIVLDEIAAAVRELPAPDWRTRLRVALETYVTVLAAEPDFARALQIDTFGAGPKALERHLRVRELFVDHYRRLRTLARADDPALGPIPDSFLRGLVGGIEGLVQGHILTRGAETLTELAPTLYEMAAAVMQGAAAEAPAEPDASVG